MAEVLSNFTGLIGKGILYILLLFVVLVVLYMLARVASMAVFASKQNYDAARRAAQQDDIFPHNRKGDE